MRFAIWLPALLALGACKPQRETVKKQVRLTTAPPAALTDAAVAAAVSEKRDLLAEVAKALIGLNPALEDRRDHIGLANIATLMGYDLPLNDCGSPWLVNGSGDGAAFTLSISSSHNRGVGPTCGEADTKAPVTYLFANWTARSDGLAWQPFVASGTVAEAPPAQGKSNASGLQGTQVGLDGQGRQVWTSQESLAGQSSGRPEGETMSLQFARTLPKAAVARLAGQNALNPSPSYGVSGVTINNGPAAPDAVYSYSVGPLTATAPALTTAECKVAIVVPAGCLFKSTLTAQFRQSKSRFSAQLHLAPTAVGFTGRLGSSAPCNHRTLKQADGSCGGQMGKDRKGVEAWFGRGGVGFNFAQDMAAQASARQTDSAGDWDFAAMRLMPGQQSQDIPTVDWALRYFQLAAFANITALFEQVDEQIGSCQVHTDILPGSAPSCTTAPADQTLEPQLHD